jgi:glucose-6-phosphate dehydrogenase assembly protein OpcA
MSDPAAAPVIDERPAVSVPLRDVERELNRQMKALQGVGPLRRARMSNLVIFCDSLAQSMLVTEQIPAISAVHPSRTILLIGDPEGFKDVTAWVSVRPIGEGSKHYACAEMVTLHAAGSAVQSLPFAVRALLIGDLPVNLWWEAPQPPPLAGSLLFDLSENAQQIIYDSIGWPDPAHGVAATADWVEQVQRAGGRWRVASDLNWRRLKYWRRLLTQALEPGAAAGAAESASEIVVEHGPHASIQAWLLASWLTQHLGWRVQAGRITPGVEMAWKFRTAGGDATVRVRRREEGPPEVSAVRIACRIEDAPGAVVISREDAQRLGVRHEGTDTSPRTMTVPPQSAVDLVGRQLSDRERDAVFRESMAVAGVMAQSLLH